MTDVLVHRCRLDIVRHGGWSWGPNPKRLLQGVVANLPALLAQAFTGIWPEGSDLELTQPLKLRIPITLETLFALGPPGQTAAAMRDVPETQHPAGAALLSQLRSAMATALAGQTAGTIAEAPPAAAKEPAKDSQTSDLDPPKQPSAADPTALAMGLLTALLECGLLPAVLSKCTTALLQSWHELLLTGRFETGGDGQSEALAKLVANRASTTGNSLHHRLATRLEVAIAAAANLGIPPQSALVRKFLDRKVPLDPIPLGERHGDGPDNEPGDLEPKATKRGIHRDPASEQTLETPEDDAPLPTRLPDTFARGEIDISCALPFLILGPLHQIGFLDLVAVQAQLLGLTNRLPAFAAALAYKVLEPPQRGWRRDPASIRTASAVAGLSAPPEEATLLAFARDAIDLCTPLEAKLTQTLLAGRNTTSAPLLLHRTQSSGDWILFESEGLFPLIRCESLEDIFPTAKLATKLPLLIDGRWLTRPVRQSFEANGQTFVTDAAPTRGESSRRFRVDKQAYFTNYHQLSQGLLRQLAVRLGPATALAEAQIDAFIDTRRAITLGKETQFERTLTQAATLALGALAWELWRERETVDPVLALTRFADLDARVFFGADTVRVRLPLGRRYQDLYRRDLLRDVPNVSWLQGRTLEFTGG